MAKKIMKRSLALGALMAFVITGSAMAGTLALKSGEVSNTYLGDYKLQDQNVNLTSNAVSPIIGSTREGRTSVLIDDGETLVIENKYDNNHIEGIIQNTDIRGNGVIKVIDYSGRDGATILGTTYSDNRGVNISADTIEFVSHGAFAIYVSDDQLKHSLEAREISIYSDGIAVYAANGSVDIKATESLVINADKKRAIRGNGNGQVDIGSAAGSNADIVINGDVDYLNGGIVNIALETEKSELNGTIKPYSEGSEGTVSLGLSDGATWNVTGDSIVNNLDLNDGIVNIVNGTEGAVTADRVTGTGGTINVDNATANQFIIGEKVVDEDTEKAPALTVSTTNQNLQLDDLVGVVSTATTGDNDEVVYTNAADFVEKTGGAVYEKESAAVVDGVLGEVSKVVDAGNLAANDMAAVGLMSWRAEMNDMNKRMGELRNANGDLGVWVRMVRGESEYNSVKNQYNQYQLGYDEKLSVDPSWTVGVALSYTDAQNNFAQGNGESTNKALSVYGSKLNEDGTFVDLIAKYARLENEFDIVSGMGDADYSTNGYSFSAEFGKRIQQGKGLWIEPQVELTYGKVSAVDYVTENKVQVAQDGMESLVGRVGFSLGKDIKDGNVYARASYLYDFDGETKATLNGIETLEQDLGGGWFEVGVGANINLSKATYIYADVEKTFGGEVDTNWQWNLGVRYSF